MTEKFDPLKIKVGNYIAYNRKINGISQEEFASLIGVSSRALSKIENGYNYPSLNAASKINEYLNISIINLMNEDDSNPNLRLNILYNKLIYSLENREYHNIKVIVLSMDDLIDKISRTSIYYKKYLFSKAWGFIIDNKLNEANDSLEEAFKLNFVKSQEDKSLNVRIYLLSQSIAPDLETNPRDIEKTSKISITNLIREAERIDDEKLKIKYLYNSLIIKIENTEDYSYSIDLLYAVLNLSIKTKNLDIYNQTIFYRGLIHYKAGNPFFYYDIDESLMYFYITKNKTFFKHNVKLLNEVILDS